MISKQQIKFIKSLAQKKYRKEHQMFVAEGAKIVEELLHSSLKIHKIFATASWFRQNPGLIKNNNKELFEKITENELSQISELTTPNEVLALANMPDPVHYKDTKPADLILTLESVRDPGNLGTIIRLADWYGLDYIVCSPDCADAYNTKVVQASMGSIFRIKIIYATLISFIENTELPVYAAVLDGAENLHSIKNFEKGILIIGNESKGISAELANLATNKVFIPSFGKAESLNAAIATGILLDNFRRLQLKN